jgi:hypothetical protein
MTAALRKPLTMAAFVALRRTALALADLYEGVALGPVDERAVE